MRYVPLILKTLLVLVCFFSYFCMMKVLYCGCWACKTGVAIGVIGLVICLYDRYHELRRIVKNKGAKLPLPQPLEQAERTRYFRHFKGGLYRYVCTAYDSETQERKVVYQALYGERQFWVRPEKMFFESVTRDGRTFPRFEEIEQQEREGGGAGKSNKPNKAVRQSEA